MTKAKGGKKRGKEEKKKMSKILLQKKQRFPQGCAFGSKSYKCRLFKRTNWCCFILVLCLMWRGSSVSGFGRQSPKRILDWPSDCFVERFEQLHTRNFSTHQRSEIAASYVSPSIDFSLDDDKTIFHLSSGVGRAGVAVIRVSGYNKPFISHIIFSCIISHHHVISSPFVCDLF